jgi:hypothetical protein
MTSYNAKELAETLEALVDQSSMRDVLFMLASIAAEKAQHLREAWQDETTAKRWDKDAKLVEACGCKVNN